MAFFQLEDDEQSIEAFLMALRDVAIAHGFTKLSKNADLGRESLCEPLVVLRQIKIILI